MVVFDLVESTMFIINFGQVECSWQHMVCSALGSISTFAKDLLAGFHPAIIFFGADFGPLLEPGLISSLAAYWMIPIAWSEFDKIH